MADDTRLTTHEGTPDLGLSQNFKDFSTFTQSSQTRGVYFPRRQKHYETQSFSEKNPTGRRSSTSPWRSHPSRRRLGLPRFWDLVKFSKIFQLLLRAPKLEECTSPDARSTMRDSRFQKKIQPADALRLPHGGVTPRAGDSQPTSEVHSGQWNTPST